MSEMGRTEYIGSAARVGIPTELLMPVLCDLLAEGKDVPLTVTGNSMQPFLMHGRDSVVVSPVTAAVRRGDVVLLRDASGRYLLHRVLRLRGEALITCGDGNMRPDRSETPGMIVGVVTHARRKGRMIGPDSFVWKFYARVWGLHPVLRRPLLWAARIFSPDSMRDAV